MKKIGEYLEKITNNDLIPILVLVALLAIQTNAFCASPNQAGDTEMRSIGQVFLDIISSWWARIIVIAPSGFMAIGRAVYSAGSWNPVVAWAGGSILFCNIGTIASFLAT